MKQKKCRNCGEKFSPFQSTQVVCSPKCATQYAIEVVKKKREKKHREQKRQYKMSDIGVQRREASKAFNAYIRYRDRHNPCISCGTSNQVQYHAGHFKTRGAHPELAFNEDNCHKQCARCNNFLSGNLVAYRENLVKKIGEKRVVDLESYHPPVKRTAKDYMEIKIKYKKKLGSLKQTS